MKEPSAETKDKYVAQYNDELSGKNISLNHG